MRREPDVERAHLSAPIRVLVLDDVAWNRPDTSLACARIERPGAAALWISKHRGASPAEVRRAVLAAGNYDWDDRDDPDDIKEPLVDVSSF